MIKTKTNTKATRVNDLKLIKKNISTYPKCFFDEYINLDKINTLYKKYYKTYESNQQISNYVLMALKFDPNLFSKLLSLSLKRFNPILLKEIYSILVSNENDNIIYNKLKKIYNSPKNKHYKNTAMQCNKNLILSQVLYYEIQNLYKNIKLTKYLDIGTGNGKFAITFGNVLSLDKNNIYGVDLETFAEKDDWNRKAMLDKFIYTNIEFNKPYPFEDNTFDIITFKMVLHHIQNIDFTFKEISRIMKKNGLCVIIEHDSFTYADYMLNDIEHGFYMNVFNTDSNLESFSKKQISNTKNQLGFVKYRDWIQMDNLLNKHNFQYMKADIFSEHINFETQPTRTFWCIYKKL